MNKLNKLNKNIELTDSKSILDLRRSNCKFISCIPRKIKRTSKFLSERIFPLYCITYGFIEGINLKIYLYDDCKIFDYIG
jgi:hypothetical protein